MKRIIEVTLNGGLGGLKNAVIYYAFNIINYYEAI